MCSSDLEMLQVFAARIRRSRSVTSPFSANTRMCVSRLTTRVPLHASRLDVALHVNPPAKGSDQIPGCAFGRHNARDWFAVLSDDDPVRVQVVQDRQALLLELRRCNLLHKPQYTTGHILCPVELESLSSKLARLMAPHKTTAATAGT